MSTSLYALGRWCFRNGKLVLAMWLALAAVLGLIAVLTMGKFNDNFEIPGSSSQEAMHRLHMTFPEGAMLGANAVIEVPEGTDIDTLRGTIEPLLDEFKDVEMVAQVRSPWFEYVKGQVSDDKRAALATLALDVSEPPTPEELQPLEDVAADIQSKLPEGSHVFMGGQAFETELPTMSVTEVFGVLLSFAVLWIMLGSALAAVVPVVTAAFGVGLAMALLMISTGVLEINSVTPILAVMLGLAIGIDYALFIYARHRDQLREGMELEESIARAIGTAGTAVVFAGLTNAIALSGLAVAGIPFMTIMGIFASVAALIAVAIALTTLPAFAGFLGERMRPKARKRRRGAVARGADDVTPDDATPAPRKPGIFHWWVGVTTSHPIITIVAVVLGLGLLSLPALNLNLSLPNAGQGAPERQSRQAYDTVAEHFGPGFNAPLVVTANIISSSDPMGLIDDMVTDLEAIDGVDQVVMAVPNQNADTALIQVIPTTASDDPATVATVERLREVTDGWADTRGIDADVTGFTAVQMDVTARLGAATGPFAAIVVGLTLVLLCAVFRSVWVPIKTAVGFLLSVGGAFGATQLAFNEGIGRQLINLEKPEAIISFMPILMMGILFGLAMDYEIFIASRIREEYTHGKPAMQAIRDGFVASGPVVTATALVMCSVFAFFVPEGMMAIKQIAFALAVGVAIDAFLVRMTFVPAVLALLGDRAWWMPKWLDKAMPVFDMEGEVLTKQLQLAEWPGTDALVHAEDVEVAGLVGPTSLQVRPGEVVGLVGTVGARAAAALALSGRLETSGGRGRIVGQLLPEAAGGIRRRTEYLDLAAERDIVARLERLRPREGQVWFLDGMDAVGTPAEREAVQRVVELARTNHFAVVVCGGSDAALTPATPDDVVRVHEPAREGSMA